MKLPRDVSGPDLVKALRKLGYEVTRQRGSHVRVTSSQGGEHHEVVPNHHPIKPGTLSSILKSVASHHRMTVEELLTNLGL
jgi:predicted RNA binding protein YcfA (HicA-like mRNA interferase family)